MRGEPFTGSLQKPKRGQVWLDGRGRRATRKLAEQKAMQAALIRDERKCRYPRCPYTGMKIDPAHEAHRGMGGNPKGDRTTRATVISLCRRHHDEYDDGLIEIRPHDDKARFDGLCDFYRHAEDGQLLYVGGEKRIGVSVTRDGIA